MNVEEKKQKLTELFEQAGAIAPNCIMLSYFDDHDDNTKEHAQIAVSGNCKSLGRLVSQFISDYDSKDILRYALLSKIEELAGFVCADKKAETKDEDNKDVTAYKIDASSDKGKQILELLKGL